HYVEGFLDRVSAVAGDEVTLYANTGSPRLSITAYRLGWYKGLGARLVASLGSVRGVVQPPAGLTQGINMVECRWSPTLSFKIEDDWPSGYYLLKLLTKNGYSQWVPFLVRDDESSAPVLVQSSVTTWQAYNLYGGYSLYSSPSGSYEDRSRVVSFDRPYAAADEDGSADLFGNEYPLVALVERLGVDVSYWTDIDLHVRPQLLARHRCLVSLGHDEYWSAVMRDSCEAALHKGLNIAFLGANACYRHIRLAPSPTGPDRRVICYKVASEDPIYGRDPAEATANWPDGPDARPESQLIGIEYQAFGGSGDLVVVDPSSWVFAGTGLGQGSRISDSLGSEFDRYVPGLPSPSNVQLLAHSPTSSVIGPSFSDMSYYTVDGGGGVYASGTAAFVDRLWANQGVLPMPFAPGPVPGATAPITRITENVLSVFSRGPASATHPSSPNWRRFYAPGSTAPPAVDVGST
ncbi:MAG: N,N-dimethylformamidase beta subunit family domain-containing protein, partial [Acidimicrobiales bacterium]